MLCLLVDLNFNSDYSLSNDTTGNGATRILLQSCLWAAKKIIIPINRIIICNTYNFFIYIKMFNNWIFR